MFNHGVIEPQVKPFAKVADALDDEDHNLVYSAFNNDVGGLGACAFQLIFGRKLALALWLAALHSRPFKAFRPKPLRTRALSAQATALQGQPLPPEAQPMG
jgi:hypothetical protein